MMSNSLQDTPTEPIKQPDPAEPGPADPLPQARSDEALTAAAAPTSNDFSIDDLAPIVEDRVRLSSSVLAMPMSGCADRYAIVASAPKLGRSAALASIAGAIAQSPPGLLRAAGAAIQRVYRVRSHPPAQKGVDSIQ